jgi:plasmid stability protein
MKKMLVGLPEDLIKEIKLRAVQDETTIKALVETALRQYLKGGEGRRK